MTCGLGPGFVLLLLLLPSLLHTSQESCPPMCYCVSDTISCSSSGLYKMPLSTPTFSVTLDLSHNHFSWLGPGNFHRMSRLENLRMAHNQIVSLSRGVFRNASSLRHIDLSSNKLRAVERHYFQGLWRLEELLLFNNKITQLESSTLSGLSSLKKAYFSLNQITHFPFFSIQDHSHPFLTMLDLSSNRMSSLPWEDVKALPRLVQRGLYLHNNSLICDCNMYNVFWHWNLRGYDPLKDFAEYHTCSIAGDPQTSIRFLQLNRFFHNCSVEKAVSLPVIVFLSSMLVTEGESLHLDCQTSLNSSKLRFTWLSPSRGYITHTNGNDSLVSLSPNGVLQVHGVTVNDSGLYVCTAVDAKTGLNATREVNVTVHLLVAEAFNTGYTTLLGCMVTTLVILMYLFLTPCRCSCCKQPGPPGTPMEVCNRSALSSVFCSRDDPRRHSEKRVSFLQPAIEDEGPEWAPES